MEVSGSLSDASAPPSFSLGLDPEKTRAQVTIHQGALEACLKEKLFQVIKEDRLVRPRELFFSLKSRKPFKIVLHHQKGFPLITIVFTHAHGSGART
jgi:hypothetical protein